METLRIDKYLWCVRLFRTRTLAGDACRGGRVKVNGRAVKPSYEIKLQDQVEVSMAGIVRKITILDFLYNRVGAALVAQYAQDLTDPEQYLQRRAKNMPFETRDKGAGRPTKRDRRDIEQLKNLLR